MTGILDAVGEVLETAEVGTLGVDLFLSRSPEAPDECLVVLETGSGTHQYTFRGSGAALVTTNVQLMARAGREDYPAARSAVDIAVAAMEEIDEVTVDGLRLLRAEQVGVAVPLGLDGNDRPRITVTFAVTHG